MEMTKKLEGKVFFFVLILLVGLALYFIFDRVFVSPEEKALRALEELKKAYQEDTYGGATPEETLQLFIDALKAGDIKLASKYFIIDERESWHDYFRESQHNGNLQAIIVDAQNLQLSSKDTERAFFTIASKANVVEVQVVLSRGPNGVWKIIDL